METTLVPLKIVICGDPEVGKTTLRRKYMGECFSTSYKPTIGVDFALTTISLGDDGTYQLQIWDLGSQEMFQPVRLLYYQSTLGALVLFDVTNPQSCNHLSNWIDEIWSHNGFGITIPVIILGNKTDLRDSMENTADPLFGGQYAQELSKTTIQQSGFQVKYLETSAKTGYNVENAFKLLIGEIVTIFGLVQTEDSKNSSTRGENLLTT